MSLNETPRSSRVHIALFGRRNTGKSSIINALTGQDISLVSDVKGTTTDPVYKAMEILPIGPTVLIDTAGIDDIGTLGEMRVEKTLGVLNKTDLALVVIESEQEIGKDEQDIIEKIKSKKIPLIIVVNKTDRIELDDKKKKRYEKEYKCQVIGVSAIERKNIVGLINAIIKVLPDDNDKFKLVGDLLSPGDLVVLVIPIDKAAPKGRLILPQQQVIRDVLEADAMCVVTKEYELKQTLESLAVKPKLVITDSQVFAKVSADTPEDVMLTSFSILFARYKGDLRELIDGSHKLNELKNGDKILIAEGCTHHRQSDDIGTVKIPRWMRQYTGKRLTFDKVSGMQYPKNIKEYALIVHCGGCMLNQREMQHRILLAKEHGIDIVNYGVIIAFMQGILERTTEVFKNC